MNTINKQEVAMPVRVELSYLSQIDGYYLLNGRLFSGLAYDRRDGQLHQIYELSDGNIIGEQGHGFFEYSGFVKLDYYVIEDDFEPGEPTFYQGQLFNGITYEYRDGFVSSEILWINGYDVEMICWFADGSGLVRKYETNYDEDKCFFEWHYKQLLNAKVEKGELGKISFQIALDDNSAITSAVLFGDCEHKLNQLVKRTDLPLVANSLAGLLGHYTLADNIELNIDCDSNFNYFIRHTPFETIRQLTLETKGLSLKALAQLSEQPNVKKLCFCDYGISDYSLQNLDEPERILILQQRDERTHDLLKLLLSIQARRQCRIELRAYSDFWFVYSYGTDGQGKLMVNVNEQELIYLLEILPLDKIIELELRQRNLSIAALQQLAKFSYLKRLAIKENKNNVPNEITLDEAAKANIQQQDERRYRLLWALLVDMQSQLHCDIQLITKSLEKYEQRYQR